MTTQEIDRIRGIAHGFRAAMDKCAPTLQYIGFRDYPNGMCGDASNLLGKYLRSIGLGGWTYMCGCRGDMETGTFCTHGWLQKYGLIVDLTPDQFPDAPAKVIVSRESEWHKQFSEYQSRPDQDVVMGDPTMQAHLDADYEVIVKTFRSAQN